MNWTDENHAKAKALWAQGFSPKEICDRLSCAIVTFRRRRQAFPGDFPARGGAGSPISDAEMAVAAKAWAAGESCEAIGARLGRSRNAIAALANKNRALFPARGEKRSKGRGSARLAAVGINAAPADVKAPRHDYDFSAMRLADVPAVPFAEAIVSGGCRFPVGDAAAPDGEDMPCCGAVTLRGQAWCAAHYRVVYQPVRAA
ncbi:GcrA family cell cycle regulator [Martelella soudanensis]|uniref:GcrA family cell cycle regulator n=1 Tax=unclassified Martelella TaxID=2629616 RepID=UPI0015DE6697|nr:MULTISPECIES: GcrA family cell cycle regulator [unclassified Martelella]